MNGRPSMTQQVLCRLMTMQAFSTSKHKERAANGGQIPEDRIYSKSTFDTYLDIGVHFAQYAEENYDCLWLDDTRPYVSNYLTQRMLDGVSPWTLHRDAGALAKLFRCTSADFGVNLPPRRRGDVTRYQNTKEEIAQFEKDYPLLAQALKECGVRRHELRLLLSVGNVRVDEKGKGGRQREIYALGDTALRMAQQAQEAGLEYICRTIPPHAPIHALRRIFAQNTYAKFARPVHQIPKKDRYVCRADMKGIVLDKRAMRSVSKALGHNRLGVVTHYLYKP